MKPATNLRLTGAIYYIFCFLYVSSAISLSLIKWNLDRLGKGSLNLRIIIFFLVLILLFNIFLPSLIYYFLLPLTISSILFILSDKKAHFLNEKFNFFIDENWQNILAFGKNWFRYGFIGVTFGLIVAIIQVQIFQGGAGGFFVIVNKCVEFSFDKSSCLLSVPSQQLVGDHLAFAMTFYAEQAFVWVGLIGAITKDKGKIFSKISTNKTGEKNNWMQKIENFRKTHYI